MLFKSLAVAAAAFGVATAEMVIPVLVGMDPNGTAGTFFSPDRITAEVGSIVQFQFMGGNHTVTQSTFDEPCMPVSMVNASATGVHSGFFPAANNEETGMVPFWNLQINDTRPLWLYCAQGRHCQAGMVMVINENTAANESRSLDNYRALAATAELSEVPSGTVTENGGTSGETTGEDSADAESTVEPVAASAAGLRVSVGLLAAVAGVAYLAI